MKLIADSGSTKTDWAWLREDGSTAVVHTQGISPVHQTEDVIRDNLCNELLPQLPQPVDSVFFYGSGVTPDRKPLMQQLLSGALQAEAFASSDLLGAARALCGEREGIACILGTGANSCYYDGSVISRHTPALGYILGDEGSGAVLGRQLVNGLYKGMLPDELRLTFEQETGLDMPTIINKVYRQPLANRFLASLSTFIHAHLTCQPLEQLVVDSFRQFLQRNVAPYRRRDLSVSAVGSIAWYYQAQLEQAAVAEGMRVGTVLRSPLDGLVAYHSR